MLSSAAAGASVRDRTAEFQQIVARLQQQQGLPSTSGRDVAAASASSAGGPQSEFARRAANIGLGIHSTSQKLQKLAQLARRTSMFDDPAEEINELSTVVKQDIQVGRGGSGGWVHQTGKQGSWGAPRDQRSALGSIQGGIGPVAGDLRPISFLLQICVALPSRTPLQPGPQPAFSILLRIPLI